MTAAAAVALDYIERGWAPIPIPYRSKSPGREGWQQLRITKDTVTEYFNESRQNIGLLLGEPSHGLVDLDMDWPEAAALRSYFIPSTLIFGRANNPSSHALVIARGAVTRKFSIATKVNGGMVLELRSTGCQTVAPGSVHEGGDDVVFENDLAPTEIAADKLDRYCCFWAAASVLLRHWADGVRDELATALAGTLLRGGWAPDKVDGFIARICGAAGDEATPTRLKATRLSHLLQAKQGHVPGYNRLKELLGDEAASKVSEWLGLKFEEDVKPFPLNALLTLADFNSSEFPPLEYVVEGLLYAPSVSMIYAPRGLGKTWLAMSMAVSLASGMPFLFWPVSRPCTVLYVDGEMPSTLLQNRFRDLTHDMNLPITIMGNEVLYRATGDTFCINNIEHQSRFFATLRMLEDAGRPIDFIFFDNLSALTFGVDENSNSEQDAMVRFYRDLRLSGKSVVFLHHSGKGGDQRGASRREDLLDLVMRLDAPTVEHQGGGCQFSFEITKSRGMAPHPLRGDARLLPSADGALAWGLSKERKDALPPWLVVLRYIADGAPRTNVEIADAVSLSVDRVSKYLKKLRSDGFVEMKELVATKRGKSYISAALKPATDDEPSF